jgi:hypothetical protein
MSNPTRIVLNAQADKNSQRQHMLNAAKGLGMVKLDNPNRAQRRAAKKQERKEILNG